MLTSKAAPGLLLASGLFSTLASCTVQPPGNYLKSFAHQETWDTVWDIRRLCSSLLMLGFLGTR